MVDRVDRINPKDYNLPYAAMGWETSFLWKQYFFDNFLFNSRFFLGMYPGYFEERANLITVGASFKFGIGRMK